jgi:tetratricopeptide (TPR) repeat protein
MSENILFTNPTLNEAASLIHANRLDEAEKVLSAYQDEADPHFWFLKGLLNQKRQSWGEAINHFHRCLDLDPDHPGASAGRDICNSILNFWNPSLFNP